MPLRRDWGLTGAFLVTLLLVFNANGREIGSYDRQPTKFAGERVPQNFRLLGRGSVRPPAS